MLRRNLDCHRTRHPRGIGLMWFALVSIPVLLFVAGLAVDLTRVVVAHREASNLASAAAVAGSYQFVSGKAQLDPVNAAAEVNRTWTTGRDTYNAARLLERGEKTKVTFDNPATPTQVSIRVDYKVSGLVFLHYFTKQSDQVYSVTRTAFVCVPYTGVQQNLKDTGGYCTRPQG